MNKKWLLIMLVVCSCALFFASGCSKKAEKPKKSSFQKEEKRIHSFKSGYVKFKRVVGWLSNNSVLIQATDKNDTKLYAYQLYSGNKKQIYQTDKLVSEVKISPDKSSLLIYDSADKHTSIIRIIDIRSGKEMATKTLAPTNNTFVWNAESPSKILLINYDQSWGFKAFLWDYNSNLTRKINAGSPFVAWYTDNFVLYNSKKQQEEAGDLYLQDTRLTTTTDLIAKDVLNFASNQSTLLTISNDSNKKFFVYKFLNVGFKKLSVYRPFRTYDESGGFIPYFDENFNSNLFLTFAPYESGKVKENKEGYSLVKVNPKTGKSKVLIKLFDNKPILTNDNKTFVLYGFDYGKVVDLKTKEVWNIWDDANDDF